MKKTVKQSNYITAKKAVAEKLLARLLDRYAYASVLITDCATMTYRISRSGISISQNPRFGGKGMVIKVYDGKGYAEYSTNDITQDSIAVIEKEIETGLLPLTSKLSEGLSESNYKMLDDSPCTMNKASEYEVDPDDIGDEKIIERLAEIREKGNSHDERILDTIVSFQYQKYDKLFLSANRKLEQSALWAEGFIAMLAKGEGDEVKQYYNSFSNLGGAELLDKMAGGVDEIAEKTLELLLSEDIVPGTYECVCTPDVTGMIVHEAFGHGVEMDMFVKDRALAKDYIGKYVASPIITMHDGNSINDVATYFFDDEGTPSSDTVIIEKGILKSGISDAQSAMYLGTVSTGNGRRESYERKAYTRMTNTYFEAGNDKVEDMIASIKYGMLLENPSSGMEDPKNWGIQCMVNIAREIKDGKLTGRIFSPIVLTGYVPDLLKSISMISEEFGHCGSGACGKGHKEWVKVSDGGPFIKARIRLG